MLLAYEEALEAILNSVAPVRGKAEAVGLAESGAIRVLAEPLVARDGNPRFDNSSVDGYAFHGDDLRRIGEPISVAMTVAAGDDPSAPLSSGLAARIFTGAKLPIGTAAVAMQEDVEADTRTVTLLEALTEGAGVRRAGADFERGTTLLEAGTPITPGVAGLLASQGVVSPRVMARPKCRIFTTGDEIVPPDKEPGPNQVRDVIGSMLSRAAMPFADSHPGFAPDNPSRLSELVAAAADENDALIVAGGASVGDRDYVARVVAALGKIEFHGLNIRPGKPLLFGQVKGTPILCLPGNPASAYVCFHLFGMPMLRRLGGWSNSGNLWFQAVFGAEHEPESRDVFARVTLDGQTATPVHEQASFALRSLGAAQALARLPGGKRVQEGDPVAITLL